MTQLNLPLTSPRERGRLNALRNIFAAISDELRVQAPVAQGIIEFTTTEFPRILRQYTPLNLQSSDHIAPEAISPFPFEIHDFVRNGSRPDVFPTARDLIERLDIETLKAPLRDVELIGIDESQVDMPLPQSTFSFLRTVAFRMYRMPDGSTDEATGPLLSEMRMQLREDAAFENENKLLGYIRNLYVAFASSLNAHLVGRKPFVVLHGPLVRTIGGFSNIIFDYETAKRLFSIDADFPVPAGNVPTDSASRYNLPMASSEITDGDKCLTKFNEFCIHVCRRKCNTGEVRYPQDAIPAQTDRVTEQYTRSRKMYPGFCLYMWALRSLVDQCRILQSYVVSAVENISAATETTRIVLPSLVAEDAQRHKMIQNSLRTVLRSLNIKFTGTRDNLYSQARLLLESLRLSDANIMSYVLSEGQYTTPVQIYRYRTRSTYVEALNDRSQGLDNAFDPLLSALFPDTPQGNNHPGYRVLMSYLRSTPLREPVRIEYFDLPHLRPHSSIMGPVYLLCLPYQEYGIPLILYYTDKVARTPTQLVRTIVEREYLDLVLQQRFSEPVQIMRILGRLSRGYFQREGFRG